MSVVLVEMPAAPPLNDASIANYKLLTYAIKKKIDGQFLMVLSCEVLQR